MKRMHVYVAVENLQQSIGFYSALFAAEPSVVKTDLRQVDTRRSTSQFRHLHAWPDARGSITSACKPRTKPS
jgi:hypothetical protein